MNKRLLQIPKQGRVIGNVFLALKSIKFKPRKLHNVLLNSQLADSQN
jgi:hypothetical protein